MVKKVVYILLIVVTAWGSLHLFGVLGSFCAANSSSMGEPTLVSSGAGFQCNVRQGLLKTNTLSLILVTLEILFLLWIIGYAFLSGLR